MIGIKFAWKRLENICHENQISLHQCKGSLDQFFNPNHSSTYIHANPNAHDHKATQEHHNKVCIFSRKLKYWKLGSRAIEAKIIGPLSCWGFKEGIGIKTISFNTKKRENDRALYRNFFAFLHHDSYVLCSF